MAVDLLLRYRSTAAARWEFSSRTFRSACCRDSIGVPRRLSSPGHEQTGVIDHDLDYCMGPTGLLRRPPGCVADHAEPGSPAAGGSSRRRSALAAQSPPGPARAVTPRAGSRSLGRAGYRGDVLGRCGSHGANALAKIERTIGVPLLIETVETLKGETIDEVATRLARRSGAQGVFILIAQGDEDRGAALSPLHRGAAAPGAPRFARHSSRASARRTLTTACARESRRSRPSWPVPGARARCPCRRSPRAGTNPRGVAFFLSRRRPRHQVSSRARVSVRQAWPRRRPKESPWSFATRCV